ncbi:MAG: ribosome biogenesis GTPase Der [Gemmatimonadota bacterium]
MRRPLPAVAVIGRPNVGKSTFFNRVLGRRVAIVEDVPGVTRDRNFARAEWAGHEFYLIDTGGLEPDADEPMAAAVRRQVLAAIEEADALVFVVDGREGPNPLDERIAEVLRRAERPVVLVVNKMDRLPEDVGRHDFWALGLGEPLPVSALSGKGSGDVLDAVVERLPAAAEGPGAEADEALYVAVIGKPNVGKSSLVNRLIGEERTIVTEAAGTTRDSIDSPYRYKGRTLVFIDTAGLRRRTRVRPGLEFYSALRTERAIDRADVCLLLIDATEPVHVQDLKIAERAWDAGCALAIVANKWDRIEKEEGTAAAYERHIRERAPSLRWVPVIFTSALTGQRVHATLDLVLELEAERTKRIATHEVNEVLQRLAARRPPPVHRGRPVKLLYATQTGTAPPSFVLFTNEPKGLGATYQRYLKNGFREAWRFTGSPIRLRVRGRRETR